MKGHNTNGNEALTVRTVLLKLAGIALGLAVGMLRILRDAFASIKVGHNDERQLHDSDLSGELNHRTGRLDSGTDPYGWYDRD